MIEVANLVYLGLGTNLGDKEKNINDAISELETRVGKMIAHSSLFITRPVGFDSKNLFMNSACVFETLLNPIEVLEVTKDIEMQLGRVTKSVNFQYKDRVIDIDILFYNDCIIRYENLIIPHPQIQFRSFVLEPLAQIASELTHPILNKSIHDLKEEYDSRM